MLKILFSSAGVCEEGRVDSGVTSKKFEFALEIGEPARVASGWSSIATDAMAGAKDFRVSVKALFVFVEALLFNIRATPLQKTSDSPNSRRAVAKNFCEVYIG